MNTLKSLIRIQVPLIILEFLSVSLIFYFGFYFYRNYNVLKISDSYEAKNLIVDSLKMSSRRGKKSIYSDAFGVIDGKSKGYIVDTREMKVSVGDTIPVWSASEKHATFLRSPPETKFYSEKFKRENNLILYLLFIPTIIVWVSERLISRKIRKIKAESKSKEFENWKFRDIYR